jgi:hypothetical protein
MPARRRTCPLFPEELLIRAALRAATIGGGQVPGLPTVPQRRLAPHRPPRQRGQQHQARIARTGAVTAPRVQRSSAPAYRPPRHLGDRPLHACQNRPRIRQTHAWSAGRGRDTDLPSIRAPTIRTASRSHIRKRRRAGACVSAARGSRWRFAVSSTRAPARLGARGATADVEGATRAPCPEVAQVGVAASAGAGWYRVDPS